MKDKVREKQHKICKLNLLGIGSGFLIFFTLSAFITVLVFALLFIFHGFGATIQDYGKVLAGLAIFENPFLWAGIILIYFTSAYLDLNSKVLGVVFCLIPIVHLAVLILLIKVSLREYKTEKCKLGITDNILLSDKCDTRYPILLIHGIFFRDCQVLNYWGRIPYILERNGAKVYYGNHESCNTVKKSGEDIAERIREIVEETGCGKVNIIAHSKGGLDVKYAVAKTGIAPYVASVTTISTPHHGCEYADFFLGKMPVKAKTVLAGIANMVFEKLGDREPDVLAAVEELTTSKCNELDRETADFDFAAHGIFTQSIGSGLTYSRSGILPLDLFSMFIRRFDGPNDGLVGLASLRWGQQYIHLDNNRRRGISHGDMIDLTRDEVPGFNVCDFYIGLAGSLREIGL